MKFHHAKTVIYFDRGMIFPVITHNPKGYEHTNHQR